MKGLLLAVGMLLASQAVASSSTVGYPNCSLTVQRAIEGQTGGKIRDVRQAHISVRSNILQADISTARKAHPLSQVKADALWRQVDRIRRDANTLVSQQGFLSAAERASYDRELDEVAGHLCPSQPRRTERLTTGNRGDDL